MGFTDYDDAMRKVESGEVYAAFVIPEDFTANLFTIVTGDFQQPNLQYYVNEKMNPVSPKVTDAGSSTHDETINSQFVSTVSSVVADTLNDKVAEAEQNLSTAQNSSAAQLSRAVDSVSDARATVSGLAASTRRPARRRSRRRASLSRLVPTPQTVQDQLQQVSDLSLTLQNSLGTFTSVAMPGMSNTNLMLSQVASQAAGSITDASNAISGAQGTVDAAADRAQGVLDMNTAVIEQLQIVHDQMPDSDRTKEQLRFAIDSLAARNAEAAA